jgi:histone H3/H4
VTSEAKLYPSAHDIKVTSAACLMLQVYIENMTIQLCRYANLIAIHAGRKTMSCKDISLTEKIARSQLHKDLKYDIDDPDRPPRINLFLD